MAVAVEDSPSVVLDEADRKVETNSAAAPWFAQFVGRRVFDCYPSAEPLFGRYFAGEEVAFDAFDAGRLARRRIVLTGSSLMMYVTVLLELDVRTLATLGESLQAIEDELAGRVSEPPGPRSRASLRALP